MGYNNFLRVYKLWVSTKSKPVKNWKLTEWFRKNSLRRFARASKGMKKNLVNIWVEIYISIVSWTWNALSCLQQMSHRFYCCLQLEVHMSWSCSYLRIREPGMQGYGMELFSNLIKLHSSYAVKQLVSVKQVLNRYLGNSSPRRLFTKA